MNTTSHATDFARYRPQSAGAVTVSQRIAHRNFRTPDMIIQDSKRTAVKAQEENGEGNESSRVEVDKGISLEQQRSSESTTIVHKSAASNLTNLSHKFCSAAELQYLQNVMASGNLKGRSTTEFYTIGKVVGVGSFAKVRLAWHKLTGQAIAIKTYEKSKMKDASHLRRVQQEIRVMEKLNHPRLIRLFETLESPKRIHLIMEFVSAGNLCSYVKRRRRLPEEEVSRREKSLLTRSATKQ